MKPPAEEERKFLGGSASFLPRRSSGREIKEQRLKLKIKKVLNHKA